MPHVHFTAAHSWVFDLDNTLYPPSARLFDQIERKMTHYMVQKLGIDAAEATTLRRQYWKEHGTTLNGLMRVNHIDAADFLADVHDIDLSHVGPDPKLTAAIDALPGRKIVFTNGSRGHADNVLAARGLSDRFDARYGIEDAGFDPKPRRIAFERVFAADGLEAAGAAMVEDDLRNLEAPKAMGMKTLWVTEDHRPHPMDAHTDDLPDFLTRVNEER